MISSLPRRIREAAKTHKLVEQELAHAVNATALVLTEAKLSSPEVRHRAGGEGDRRTDRWFDSVQIFSNTPESHVSFTAC